MRRLARRYEREFTCGACRDVIARISVSLMSRPRIESVRGDFLTPVGGWLLQAARQQAERARRAGVAADLVPFHEDELRRLRARTTYLERGAGELSYELACPGCQCTYLRTLPALMAEVRASDTGRVTLVRQPQDLS